MCYSHPRTTLHCPCSTCRQTKCSNALKTTKQFIFSSSIFQLKCKLTECMVTSGYWTIPLIFKNKYSFNETIQFPLKIEINKLRTATFHQNLSILAGKYCRILRSRKYIIITYIYKTYLYLLIYWHSVSLLYIVFR